MRFSFILAISMVLWMPWGNAQAAEIFKKDQFTVRKVEGTCKLEIQLHDNERAPAAILAIFPSDDFYGELFTEKPRIGLAKKSVKIRFDNGKAKEINFIPDAAAEDSYWRWQYLDTSEGLLDNVSRKGKMYVEFSNGQQDFSYTVPLKGSGNAVKALKKCK